MHECKLRYSEPLLREAVRAFVFRTIVRQLGISFFFVATLIALFFIYLLLSHDWDWTVGFLGAGLPFACLMFISLYVVHARSTIGRFRRMRSPEATFAYNEEQVSFASELGSSTLPWSSIAEVWRFPRFWLLLFSRAQFVTLPLDCLDDQAQAFISLKTKQTDRIVG
ncbi:YcxB family protein [Tundrisphaera sp. TA3]|uniref:YcxB family protein n=1 Tax=Tundrisphaera sp. TA3 TaxID=3435775 RepID=UPI003EBA4BA9